MSWLWPRIAPPTYEFARTQNIMLASVLLLRYDLSSLTMKVSDCWVERLQSKPTELVLHNTPVHDVTFAVLLFLSLLRS